MIMYAIPCSIKTASHTVTTQLFQSKWTIKTVFNIMHGKSWPSVKPKEVFTQREPSIMPMGTLRTTLFLLALLPSRFPFLFGIQISHQNTMIAAIALITLARSNQNVVQEV